nr:guanine nucleotide exchange protein for ADP-robosylation factor [Polyrhizophydium stewartii]
MLKFAERYLKGNPKAFSSADTAYVLAYSVIMLNTDQHNAQVKRRMTKEDFLKNNRGIDEGKDLPAEFLGAIFDEIQSNEIVMKDEAKAKDGAKAEKSNALGLPVEVDALLFGKPKRRDGPPDISKTTESMALKTEAIFTSILRSKSTVQKSTRKEADGANAAAAQARERIVTAFFSASHYEHVRPMFQLVWMSLLTAISTPLQETEDLSTISVALDGFRSAAYIACIFDMELESKAFISTLGKFTILNNIQEMRAKNFEAIKTLLDIAFQQGNSLGESWKVVVQCISQLEKLQIVGALGEDGPRARPTLLDEVAAEASSQSMTLSVDRIFTASAKLSGAAIVHFVRALCEMSWEEIKSSMDREHPRMYCLQRLVEISYYNMKRIRVEWSNIWAILGQHFNQVGSSPNTTVAFFAVDKLRQLAIKFLELEELPNFKFQKDFLRPFEEIIRSNPDVKIKDMCLACIQQMVQAKSRSLKSGWKTLFGALLRPSRETNEPLVVQAFEIIKSIYKTSFEGILANAAYPEFVGCVVEFCKNAKFGKISLHAIELLRQSIGRVAELLGKGERHVLLNSVAMASTPTQRPDAAFATPSQTAPRPALSDEDASVKFWMPVLFGLQDVIMASELEVRTRALQYLFETLKLHGSTFSRDFWALLAKGVLFPIFDDLKHSGTTSLANSKFASKEEMLVWLSTTLIQALRQLVELFGTHFESLRFMLDGMLEILTTCLTHENEALSRIGSTCLQQLVEHNAQRFEKQEWTKVVELFERLSQDTTPYFLFFDMAQIPGADSQAQQSPLIDPASLDPELAFLKAPLGPPPDKREFQRLIGKCVLHLLVMQTLDETLLAGQSDTVFRSLSAEHMFRLTDCFDHSFRFARAFNKYTSLRTAIYRMGYMKQMPNLLKQETQSVTAYIRCLAKVSLDRSPETSMLREKTEKRLIPLCLDILSQFNSLDGDAKRRNINSWKPVVVIILNALMDLSDDPFSRHIKAFYPGIVNLLLNDITPELRVVLHSLLMRTGVVLSIIEEEEAYQPRSLASGDGTAANTDSAAAASATSAADDGADPMQQADGDDEARQ